MAIYICPRCKIKLSETDTDWQCNQCNKLYPKKSGFLSMIKENKYWGEFSEKEMDILLNKIYSRDYQEAKTYIDKELNRKEFIFGKSRSDFIYYFNLDKDTICLDTGCGLGANTFNIAPYVKEVYAFDQSLKRVMFCNYRKKFEDIKNVNFCHTDFKNLPFQDNFFNVIIMNGVVEWLGEINEFKNPRDDQLAILRKIYTKLKKGGQIYIGIENRFASVYLTKGCDHSGLKYTSLIPRFLANAVMKIKKGKQYRTYTYSIFGYKKLLKDSGFKSENIDYYIAYPGYNRPQYIIPFDDLQSLSFFLRNMTKKKGLLGGIVRFLSKYNLFLRIIRHFFYSYLIYIKK